MYSLNFLNATSRFVDYQAFFRRSPQEIPVIWRLADMNALTGG